MSKMANTKYIYGLPLRCMRKDHLIEKREILFNDHSGQIAKIEIIIIGLDLTLSIRDFLTGAVFQKSLNPVLCRFYVVAHQNLSEAQLRSVSEEIIKMKDDGPWTNLNKMSSTDKYSIKCKYHKISDVIDLVPRIYLYFGHYKDVKNKYIFINSTSSNGMIETNEDCIEYIHFDKRTQYVPTLHGKVNFDHTVDTFEYYPLMENIPKVFLLKEGWTILRSNKIAIRIYGNIVFWLLTCQNTFIAHSGYTNRMDQTYPSCSIINTSSLTKEQIGFIYSVFKKDCGFTNVQFDKECIYSTDETNNLFMFTGVMQQDQMGIFGNLFNIFDH